MKKSGWSEFLHNPLNLLLLAFPATLALELGGASPLIVFIGSALAIVPLAGVMGTATESLAAKMGPAVGGLLNATFGNAAELIIAIMALKQGPRMFPLVKASITGSIIGNFLLVTGAAMFAGGLKYQRQEFNRVSASASATMMALAAIGLLVPTIFYHLARATHGLSITEQGSIQTLSEEIALVLVITYLLGLVFSLVTHRQVFQGGREAHAAHPAGWSVRASLIALVAATTAVAVASEWLTGSVEAAAHAMHLNPIFVGAIVVAIVGNAAEHSTAVMLAMKNDMDTALQISVGSATQIALLVAPLILLASVVMGHSPAMDLHFSPLEVVAVLASVGVFALVAQDGETNWLEGLMLMMVYVIFALAFFHFPYGQG